MTTETCFSAADMADAQAKAFRAGQESAAGEVDRLQRIIDSRPAINAGLPETYIQWSQSVMKADIAQAIGHNAQGKPTDANELNEGDRID